MTITAPTPLRTASLVALTSLALVSGCANMSATEKGTAQGAGLGALGGAILSSVTGGNAGTGAVIGGAIGAVAGNVWSKRMEDKRRAMEAATQGTGVEVTRTADNRLQVNVPSDISFAVGRADLRPDLLPVLDKFASGLDATMTVHVVGHTDNTGSDAINDPLSVNRASSVKSYLVSRGVPSTRVTIEGRGAHQPIADNATEQGRARNRRVEIFLSDQQPG